MSTEPTDSAAAAGIVSPAAHTAARKALSTVTIRPSGDCFPSFGHPSPGDCLTGCTDYRSRWLRRGRSLMSIMGSWEGAPAQGS